LTDIKNGVILFMQPGIVRTRGPVSAVPEQEDGFVCGRMTETARAAADA